MNQNCFRFFKLSVFKTLLFLSFDSNFNANFVLNLKRVEFIQFRFEAIDQNVFLKWNT